MSHKKWKDTPFLWIERMIIINMHMISKIVWRFNIISIKIPMAFFSELKKKLNPEIYMESEKTQNSQRSCGKTESCQ